MQCVPNWLLEHLAFGWWKIKKGYMSNIMSLDRYLTYVGYMSTKHLSMKVGMYVCLFHQIKIKSRQRSGVPRLAPYFQTIRIRQKSVGMIEIKPNKWTWERLCRMFRKYCLIPSFAQFFYSFLS